MKLRLKPRLWRWIPIMAWCGLGSKVSLTLVGAATHTGEVQDAHGSSMKMTGLVAVAAANNSPPSLAPIADVVLRQGMSLQLTNSATDPDADPLTFSVDAGAPAGLVINSMTGVLSWTPTAAQTPGIHWLTVRVTDDGDPPLSDARSFSVFVEVPARWSFTTGQPILTSPAVGADGTVYFGSYDRNLYAVTPTGGNLWHYALTTPAYKKFNIYTGIFSSPAIGPDGTLYFGGEDDHFYAINPADGSLKWEYITGDSIYSDPAIGADGTIYFGSYDTNLYALWPNGSLRWKFTAGDQIYSDPVVGPDGTVYFGCDNGKLYAVSAGGIKQWEFQGGNGITGSPVLDSDGTIYFGATWGATGRRLYAVHPNGSLKWSFPVGDYVESSPAIGPDGTVYFGANDRKLYALNADGTKKWEYLTGGSVRASPAVAANGVIYFGSDDKKLYAVDAEGHGLWTFTTGGEVYSSPAVAADGSVYVCSQDGRLYALTGTSGLAETPWPMFGRNRQHTRRLSGADGTPPVITCSSNRVVECTGTAGTVVTFVTTASDETDSSPTVTCQPTSGSSFSLGQTSVTCTATDVSGNVGQCSFTVTIQDRTAPIVNCPTNLAASCTTNGAEVFFDTPTAIDLCDTNVLVTCLPPSGSLFHEGTTEVTCVAVDNEGNMASCSFAVPILKRDDLQLSIKLTGTTQAVVAWPQSYCWELVSSPTLALPRTWNVVSAPIIVQNGRAQATVMVNQTNAFYQLRRR